MSKPDHGADEMRRLTDLLNYGGNVAMAHDWQHLAELEHPSCPDELPAPAGLSQDGEAGAP